MALHICDCLLLDRTEALDVDRSADLLKFGKALGEVAQVKFVEVPHRVSCRILLLHPLPPASRQQPLRDVLVAKQIVDMTLVDGRIQGTALQQLPQCCVQPERHHRIFDAVPGEILEKCRRVVNFLRCAFMPAEQLRETPQLFVGHSEVRGQRFQSIPDLCVFRGCVEHRIVAAGVLFWIRKRRRCCFCRWRIRQCVQMARGSQRLVAEADRHHPLRRIPDRPRCRCPLCVQLNSPFWPSLLHDSSLPTRQRGIVQSSHVHRVGVEPFQRNVVPLEDVTVESIMVEDLLE
mmetsp:Transcript_97555/g.280756  ORF Transcript_97555/g.280756 Transcript_97555/m.280756 type:complete len:290 (+) Transcript_97555:1492-2361(+)